MQNYVLYDLTQRLPLWLYIHMYWNFFPIFIFIFIHNLELNSLPQTCVRRLPLGS